MLKKTITYKSMFEDDKTFTEDFYFNLTKAELAELELSVVGGYSKMIMDVADRNDIPGYIATIKDLIDRSYGVKSADGKRFVKTKEALLDFKSSDAYSELLLELIDPDNASKFIKGVIPWTQEAEQTYQKMMAERQA